MAEPNVQYWVGAKFTLKEIASPASTWDIWVTNRPRMVNDATATVYHPIVVKVSELGVQAGIVLPEVTGGQIILDNRPGTWSSRQKFTDLLERYAIVDQPVAIYMDTTAGDSNNFSFAAGDMIWSGHVESVENQISGPDNVVSINISVNQIPDGEACYTIYTVDSTAPAPAGSIGQTLPIIAGSAIVPAYVAFDGGSIFALSALPAGLSISAAADPQFYMQDPDGVWQEIDSTGWAAQGSGADAQKSLNAAAATACTIINDTNSQPVYSAKVEFHPGDPSGTVELDGVYVTCGIAEFDAAGVLGDNLTEGSVDLGNYETQNRNAGSADFDITFVFDPIIMPDPAKTYALTLSVANWKTGTPSFNIDSGVSAQRYYISKDATAGINNTLEYLKNTNADGAYSWIVEFVTLDPAWVAADAFTSPIGIVPSWGQLTAASAQVDFDYDLVIHSTGLIDDISGTISGTPSSALTRPDWFLNALQYKWNGTAWADSGDWDFTTLATQYAAMYDTANTRGRVLAGCLPGFVTVAEVMEAVCRDTATRVGINNSGKLFPWPWGYAYSVTKHIPAEDIIPEAWNIADPTSVVNRVTVNYSKDPRGLNLYRNLGKDLNAFSASIDWGYDTNALTQKLSTGSFTLFGNRPAAEINTNFIGDAVSAATLAQYLLATCAYPTTTAVFTVPFSEYKALKMFDVITFAHPEFPAYNGTHPDDVDPVLEGNAMRANLHRGYPFVRAQQYRGLIEGRFINMPDNGPPSIRLIVRVNTNYPADPT